MKTLNGWRVRYWGALALLTLAGAGCQTMSEPHAKTGWRFEVLKPPVMISGPNITAVTTNASSGLVGIDQATAMTAMPAPVSASAVVEGRYSGRVRGGVVAYPAAGGCDLQELCDRLDRIERRMSGPPAGMPPADVTLPPLRGPMPKGPPCH